MENVVVSWMGLVIMAVGIAALIGFIVYSREDDESESEPSVESDSFAEELMPLEMDYVLKQEAPVPAPVPVEPTTKPVKLPARSVLAKETKVSLKSYALDTHGIILSTSKTKDMMIEQLQREWKKIK